MALVVEDGTGLSTAESYISVADADTYISLFKGTDDAYDAATTAEKEIAARIATQYLDGYYKWRGEIYNSTQTLDWPRSYVFDERDRLIEGIPTNLEQATAEIMFLHLNGTSLILETDGSKNISKEKVDVIEIEYEDGTLSQPSFPTVSRLLKGLIFSSGRIERG